MLFRDRIDAGRRLATLLAPHRGTDGIVLGLPRGGVPVAFEVARALSLPLDVVVVRKLGAPIAPELGMGAVAEGGARYLDRAIVDTVGATSDEVAAITAREQATVERRVALWRAGRPLPDLTGKTAIVVDDGVATGGTMRAALRAVRALNPARLVLAVPVAPVDTLSDLEGEVDELVCCERLRTLHSIGEWYDDFTQVPDQIVTELLGRARGTSATAQAPA